MKITDFENSLRVKFFNKSGLKAYDGHIMDGEEVVWKEQYVKWLENLVKNNGVLDDVIVCEHNQHWRTPQEDGSVKKVCCKCNDELS